MYVYIYIYIYIHIPSPGRPTGREWLVLAPFRKEYGTKPMPNEGA